MLGVDWGLVLPPFFQRNEDLARGESPMPALFKSIVSLPFTNPSLHLENVSPSLNVPINPVLLLDFYLSFFPSGAKWIKQ